MVESHSPKAQRNTSRGIFGSLALRVFLVSVVFLVVPLILYSLVIYYRDYRQKVRDAFLELQILEEDQLQFISQIEAFESNFLGALHGIISISESSGKEIASQIGPILERFVQKENITALFYLSGEPDGNLICTASTLPSYKNQNFSQVFAEQKNTSKKEMIFIGEDPIFKKSLYIARTIGATDKHPDEGIIVASISLDLLLEQLAQFRSVYQTNISILTPDKHVVNSTDPDLKHQVFQMPLAEEVSDQAITLEETRTVPGGYRFYYLGKKRFAILAPFPNTDYYLLISLPARVLLLQMYRYIAELAGFLVFILIVGGLVAYLLTLRMAKPLLRLRKVMTKVGEGDLHAQFSSDPMGFEINTLGESFNRMIESLNHHIEVVKTERAHKEAYVRELQIARDIQLSILPKKSVSFPNLDVATFFVPAKEVGGDFYDWTILGDDKVIITIADGVDKGVSSCLYSFCLRSILRSYATEGDDLVSVVKKTNSLFCRDTQETGSFVTAFIVLYDRTKNEIQYANCGHNAPILKRKDQTIKRLQIPGVAFGVVEFETVKVGSMKVYPGDTLFLFTDGITEAQNQNDELFGEARLVEIIEKLEVEDAKESIGKIIDGVSDFVENASQHDDMTLIAVRFS